jgi:hypothetical protein
MLALQQGQLISSLWGALPQVTTDPVLSESQNSQVYEGESITILNTITISSIIGSSSFLCLNAGSV